MKVTDTRRVRIRSRYDNAKTQLDFLKSQLETSKIEKNGGFTALMDTLVVLSFFVLD